MDFGYQLYAPPWVAKNIPGAEGKMPSVVAHPNIKLQFARSGWSSVWAAQLTNTGLIVPAYKIGDDPEIYFNNISVDQLGLGAIFNGNPQTAVRKALSLASTINQYNEKLKLHYSSLDGIYYSAYIICSLNSCRTPEFYKRNREILVRGSPKPLGLI